MLVQVSCTHIGEPCPDLCVYCSELFLLVAHRVLEKSSAHDGVMKFKIPAPNLLNEAICLPFQVFKRA